jgi:hypothetical protein
MIGQHWNDLTIEEALQLVRLGRVIKANGGKLKNNLGWLPGERDTTAAILPRTRPSPARQEKVGLLLEQAHGERR